MTIRDCSDEDFTKSMATSRSTNRRSISSSSSSSVDLDGDPNMNENQMELLLVEETTSGRTTTRRRESRGKDGGRRIDKEEKEDDDDDDENDRDYIRKELANQKETLYVDLLRYFVIVILVCSAATISTITYMLIEKSEQDAMTSQYNGAASKVIESFEMIIHKIGLFNTIGIAATTYGHLSENSGTTKWPFVTIPDFQQAASTARLLSGSIHTSFAPIVQNQYRTAWEEFVVQPENTIWM
jgi:hypothetical protein